MKLTLSFIFILLSVSHSINAQQRVSGQVRDETAVTVSGVRVHNVATGEETVSAGEGKFSIAARPGDELRFISFNFERYSRTVTTEDFGKSLTINLISRFREIERVDLGYKPTGNLFKDVSGLPKDKKKERMDEYLYESIALGEDKTKVKPQARIPKSFDYTGIVEGGFMAKFGNKRDRLHYAEWVNKSLGDEYFKSIGIPNQSILSFILYCFKTFDIKNIIRYGIYTDEDLTLLKVVMEEKKDEFLKAPQK
ncbi:carboxypeptidase-like regulatory domain-containing protein [Elizabethkingia meningoseptica]|uniref:carboxypeptidase-like regulatory domain-containing protein n=1 Tax=Elizabethkingia meningoseptica TaxID=238 RepID=UPI0023B07F45|nr:carboxypeptidase-like regulatory domain-containing protein [Elizabethkingia meningoseptica]